VQKADKPDIVRAWLRRIDEPCSLIYHRDGDGVCSAALFARELQRLRKKLMTATPNDMPGIGVSDSLLAEAKNPFLIFTDLAVDEMFTSKKLNELDSHILILDHHVPRKNLTGPKIMHINPRFTKPEIYQPASYLVYKIAKLPDLKWIAAVGVIADHGEEDCQDLMNKIKNEQTLALLSDSIAAAKAINGNNGIMEAFDIFVTADRPKDVLNSPLIRYVDKFKQELGTLEHDFLENATFFSKTNSKIYEVKSRYQITSSLANTLAAKNPNSVIILLKFGKMLKVSARCHSGRIDVAKLLRETVTGLGVGGGHERASGAAVPARHVEKFMERLREKLEFGF
jgi:single-stranded DNA-specific DHH superfamily exonuclease